MKDKENLLDPIWEKAEDYGKTSIELIKLKAIDKASDIVSSLIPNSLAVGLIFSFVLFLSLGTALWLGEIFGSLYLGFFAVAAFFAVGGLIIYFVIRNWLKERLRNNIIKQLLK